jgi:23S rRNA (cytidine1920-2'-O)/16S rRNA (cytidine1409-2'-O)-methyltransferase
MRLLAYLLEHDLAPDERSARGLILRGDVLVDERPVTSEHAEVPAGSMVRVRDGRGVDVSRGAAKLRPVALRLGFDCGGCVALDLGVSTGGCSQVLLEQEPRCVYAVDVAYGVTALAIRDDPRVVLLERTNARELTREQLPEQPARVVGDLSFISWKAVLPAVVPLLDPHAELLLLVKPQFELAALGRGELVPGGVVRDPDAARACLEGLYNTWAERGLGVLGVVPAAVRGARGNQEYFVHLKRGEPGVSERDYALLVAAAVQEAVP